MDEDRSQKQLSQLRKMFPEYPETLVQATQKAHAEFDEGWDMMHCEVVQRRIRLVLDTLRLNKQRRETSKRKPQVDILRCPAALLLASYSERSYNSGAKAKHETLRCGNEFRGWSVLTSGRCWSVMTPKRLHSFGLDAPRAFREFFLFGQLGME